MTIYGYARVSTDEQTNSIQVEQLKSEGATNIIEEKRSAKNLHRDKLQFY
jgi:DNA invertase Pin-like site-specific DNA recombinase